MTASREYEALDVIWRTRTLRLTQDRRLDDWGTHDLPDPQIGSFEEINDPYCWRNGFVQKIRREGVSMLIGVFPARQQRNQCVYGGSPMNADVLQVMGRWGLTQDEAVWLMHEDS